MQWHWREDKRQKTWLWVGVLFLVFYFAEAFLFWGPKPRIMPPPYTPLAFWGLFGVGLIWIISRPIPSAEPPTRLVKIQSWMLGTIITGTAICLAFLVICRTGDLTLGHVVLLGVLAQAGLIIAALTFNIGWLAGGLVWLGGSIGILCHPHRQDYIVGAAVALGFILIGSFRKCLGQQPNAA